MGIVHDINRIMDYINHPGMRFFEMPHYFKVIYPKILEKTEMLTASDPKLVSLPKKVRDREVVVADRKIFVDSSSVEFSIYDHKIIDNDIVSLSFNGDWILEHYTISNKPYKFKIDLNKEGYNYLLLHAEDVGRNPPASIAVSYFYNGKEKTILLNSD